MMRYSRARFALHAFLFPGLLLGLGLATLYSPAAFAAEPGPGVITAATVLKLFLSLALVIVLIFGLGWYARRMQGFSAGQQGASMQVLAATPVGSKERVVLLRVGEEQLLLGVAPGSVQMLSRIKSTAEADIDNRSTHSNKDQSFAETLGRAGN